MSILSVVALGFAMSADAFAAALARGACMSHRPRFRQALTVGITFGVVEAITPLLGWMLGAAASQYITAYDHWVAFFLLLGLGLHMVWKSFQPVELDCDDSGMDMDDRGQGVVTSVSGGGAAVAGRVATGSLLSTVMTSVATSLDAMAVGVTLAFVDVPIGQVALVIGLCTMVMVTLGVLLGRMLGTLLGRRAEMLGGAVLIAIGSVILYEHLTEGAVLALLRSGSLG